MAERRVGRANSSGDVQGQASATNVAPNRSDLSTYILYIGGKVNTDLKTKKALWTRFAPAI